MCRPATRKSGTCLLLLTLAVCSRDHVYFFFFVFVSSTYFTALAWLPLYAERCRRIFLDDPRMDVGYGGLHRFFIIFDRSGFISIDRDFFPEKRNSTERKEAVSGRRGGEVRRLDGGPHGYVRASVLSSSHIRTSHARAEFLPLDTYPGKPGGVLRPKLTAGRCADN